MEEEEEEERRMRKRRREGGRSGAAVLTRANRVAKSRNQSSTLMDEVISGRGREEKMTYLWVQYTRYIYINKPGNWVISKFDLEVALESEAQHKTGYRGTKRRLRRSRPTARRERRVLNRLYVSVFDYGVH